MTDNRFDIREVPGDHPANLQLGTYAFTSSPQVPNKEKDEQYLAHNRDNRVWFSYLEDEPVARVAAIPMTLNVRGTILPMGGIGGVCSMPVARRGGHVRALMNHSIQEMHADGQVVSTLYPFKSSYYEMFGYAGWQVPLWARIEPAALAPYLKLPKHGTVKQRLSPNVQDEMHAFLLRAQQDIHGMAHRDHVRTDHGVDQHSTWFMSVEEGDQITGGISYKIDLEKEVMAVKAVFWHTRNAKLNVLDFMARHVDQVKQIRMPLLPGEEPHLWVSDDWQVDILSREDYSWGPPMGRIVTISGLEGISVGDATANFSVKDDQAPWNCGTWTFSCENGTLRVTEGGAPGGEVHIAGLSAMLFSGLDPLTLPHRGWGSVDDATAEALKTLFPPVTPYLHELF